MTLTKESIFDNERESGPLDNETESGDEINIETIPLPNSEMNYDDVMKMLTNLIDFALFSRYHSRN
jgi:hypothetical protein